MLKRSPHGRAQPAPLVDLFTGRQPAVVHDDAPPRQSVGGRHDPPDGARGARMTSLGGDVAVAHHFTAAQAAHDVLNGTTKSCFRSPSYRHGPEHTEPWHGPSR